LVNYFKFKRDLVAFFILIFIGISLILIMPFSYTQTNGDSLLINSNFNILELGEDKGELINISTVEFLLPSNSWNLTNVELNFTDINFKREVIGVEDEVVGHSKLLDKQERGYAVQINITEPTEIYAVHLYGDETKAATTTDIIVQINGYNNLSDKPNNTIYGSTLINITNQKKWHIQRFSEPVFLTKGYYYLVLNGTEMLPFDPAKYYWEINDINPRNPNLHTWENIGGIWTNNMTGEPFLYKLDQKVTSEIYPDEINLTVVIGEIYYPISNGPEIGTGLLNISLNFSPGSEDLIIPIISNKSFGLIYNISYNIKLRNYIFTQGTGLIEENSAITWILTPNIVKYFNQHSIKFVYPISWQNLTIERKISLNWVNINTLIILDEINNFVLIPHSAIINGAEWRITAKSPKVDFSLNFPSTDWSPEQELQFSVFSPIIGGNITFLLLDPLGFEEYFEVKEVTTEETIFTYIIPSNAIGGLYTAKIYWNNETDAGIQTQQYEIVLPTVPFTMDPWMIFAIILITVGISVAGIISYRTIKTMRNKQAERKQKLYDSCIDILNLDYIMVTDKKSGLNVYTQNFIEKAIDASLISGFLQAIQSFGIELIKVEDQS